MSETTTEVAEAVVDPATAEIIDRRQLAEQLLAQAREQGVCLVGPGWLLNRLVKNVLETALDAELTEYLEHERGEVPIAKNETRGGSRCAGEGTEAHIEEAGVDQGSQCLGSRDRGYPVEECHLTRPHGCPAA